MGGAPCHTGATAEPARVSTEAATEQLRQLRAACSAWFASVNGGLQEAYDFDKAKADQVQGFGFRQPGHQH